MRYKRAAPIYKLRESSSVKLLPTSFALSGTYLKQPPGIHRPYPGDSRTGGSSSTRYSTSSASEPDHEPGGYARPYPRFIGDQGVTPLGLFQQPLEDRFQDDFDNLDHEDEVQLAHGLAELIKTHAAQVYKGKWEHLPPLARAAQVLEEEYSEQHVLDVLGDIYQDFKNYLEFTGVGSVDEYPRQPYSVITEPDPWHRDDFRILRDSDGKPCFYLRGRCVKRGPEGATRAIPNRFDRAIGKI